MSHKILIVDDEAEVRKVIKLQLAELGHEIVEAKDGKAGIAALDNEDALLMDVIICDVRMPKINGVEAVAYFRKEYPSIPVIVLTGYPDVNLAVEFMKEGVIEYLVKPVEKEQLIAAVDKAIQSKTMFSGDEQKM